MAKNNTDLDLQEDNKEPQTPFGGWASSRPRSDDDAEPSGPRAVITSEDGSQRAASPEELATPKYGSAPAAQKPAEPPIRSFSATFGVAIPPVAATPSPKPEEPKPAAHPAPTANGTMTFVGTPHLVQFAAVKDTQLFAPAAAQNAVQASPSLPQAPQEPDPFAWTPEEVPVASAEPRRQVGGDSWIGAVDINYGNNPSPFVDPAADAPAPEPEPEAIVNPFITGQPAWQAPSLQDFTATEPEPETEEEDDEAPLPQNNAEPAAPSPFNFVAYDAAQAEAPAAQSEIPAVAAPLLFDEAPLPETPEEPLPASADIVPQPAAESPYTQPAEVAAPPAPAADIFAPINESPEVTQPAPSIFAEMPVQPSPLAVETIVTTSNIFAEAELEMDITQTEQGGESPEHTPHMAAAEPLPEATASVLAEDYLPETQPLADIPHEAMASDLAAAQTQQFDDLPEQQELPPVGEAFEESLEEASFNSTVSAVNLRHLTPDAVQHILQEHALWLSSGGRNGRRANFRNANLRGVNLSQAHLAEASLRGADLSGSNLSGSDLHGADLSEAFLSHADLRSTNLTAAIVTHVDMRTAAFEGAVMQGADLSGSSLAGANLAGLDFAGAVMQDTDLNGANLSQANLSGTNLRGAHLISANLSYASLASANCRDVQFNGAILDYANLEGASLKNARMQGASLIGIDITAAEEASDEHRHESLQSERELLQQEWQKLQALESQIQQLQGQMQQREMALQSDRSQVERAKRDLRAEYEGMQQLMEKAHQVMRHHRMHDRQFKYYGVTWFIFTILAFVSVMLFVKALEIASLDWLSIAIVLGGCALILGLFIATTVRSIKLSNNLKRLLDVYDQLFPRTDNSGQ